LIRHFNFAVNRALITYREPILDMQLVQERIANAAMDLFASTCVLSRIDGEIQFAGPKWQFSIAGPLGGRFVFASIVPSDSRFPGGLTDNDDKAVIAAAKSCLTSGSARTAA
jgi:hypothetical protein